MVRLSPRSFRVLEDGARPVASPGDHVGLVLREARLASGRDLGQIATALRIRHSYLAAIEDGRFDILPGPTYAVGFVRSYAEHLGLRPDLLVDRFKTEASGVSTRQALDFPTPMPEGRFPGGAMLAVGAVFAAAIFGGWYYLDQHGRLTYPRVPQLPAAIASVPPRLAAPFVAPVPPRAESPAAPVAAAAAAIAPVTATVAVPVETGRVVTEAPPARDPAASIIVPPTRPEATAAGEEDEPVAAGAEPTDTIPPEAAEAEEDGTAAAPAGTEPAPANPVPPTPAPANVALPAGAPAPVAAATGPAPASPVARPTPMQPTATVPAVPPPALAPVQQAALPEPPQAPSPVGDAGRVLGRVNQDARIVLNATADSWVQVRDGEQNVLFTQMLRAGDSYRVPNRDGLVLLTGNAGGLVIAVDGDPVPMLGPEGAVLRNVRLDAAALKTGTAARN